MWAATNAGVVRFDGRHFNIFNKIGSGYSGDLTGYQDARFQKGCTRRWSKAPVSDRHGSFC